MTPCPASAATRSRTGPRLAVAEKGSAGRGAGRMTSATPTRAAPPGRTGPVQATRAVEPSAEPLVRRVVQGERVLGHIRVGAAERAAHHRGRALVDRQPAGHVGREAHPQQPVLPDRAVHVGAELHRLRAVPEQRLLGDPQVAEGNSASSRAPSGQRCAVTLAWPAARAGAGSLRGQQPRALPPARVGVVLLLEEQLVAAPAAQQLGAGPLVARAGSACRPGPGRPRPGTARSRSPRPAAAPSPAWLRARRRAPGRPSRSGSPPRAPRRRGT